MYFLTTRPAGFRVVYIYRLCTIYLYKLTALYGMPSLKEIRDILLFVHSDNLINDEELLLLFDLNIKQP